MRTLSVVIMIVFTVFGIVATRKAISTPALTCVRLGTDGAVKKKREMILLMGSKSPLN